jgi:predicted amidohydrolase YtcJ
MWSTAGSLLGSMQDKLWGVRTFLRMCVLAGWGLGFAAGASASGQTGNSVAPDAVFYHGNILTGTRLKAGDANTTPGRVSAVAIRAGKVVAVGGDAAMLAMKDAHTKTIDLKGAFAMPGFNDAHTHMAPAGRQRLTLDLDNVASLAAMLAQVQAYAAKLAPGEWILGGGWDHTKWAGSKLPTRQDLDAVSAGHPAFLERTDGHIAIANSAALKAAGISDTTPNPKGGQIDRDADGHATGILREGPTLAMVEKVIPAPTLAVRRKAIELSIEDALSHGVTSIQDFSDWEDFLAMEEMEHAGTLHLRIAEWIDFNLPVGVLDERRASHPSDDSLLHLTMLKGFMDGSLGSRTAAMNAPYADDPNNYGIARYDQAKLNQMAAARAANGFQLGFHAIGDAANDMALNAMAAAEQVGRPANVPAPPGTVKPRDFRFRIEHAQVVSPGAFERFAELGVIVSMQPSHLLTDMAWAEARLGPERVKRAYAWKSFLDHGVTLAFGTDYPVEAISPFRGLYAATTRQNVEGTQTFQPQEKLTIDEAIYAYTQASAFAEFREKIKGRLEPGYLADMVVLDRDITKASPQEVLHTQVLRTVLGGETVYQAP